MTRREPRRSSRRFLRSATARVLPLASILAPCLLAGASVGAEPLTKGSPSAPPPPALLVLSSFQANLPFPRSLERGIDDALEREGRGRPAYFEYLDADRFPIAPHEDALVRLIHDKYADKGIGALVAWGDVALGVIDRRFEVLAPPRVVAIAVSGPAFERFRTRHPDTVQLTFPQDYAASLRVAMEVSRAARLVLVGENGEGARRQWETGVLAGWAAAGDGRPLINLTNLPVGETLKRIADFPSDTAFFAMPMFHDADGAPAAPSDMATVVTARASGPVFSHWDPFLGRGIVGGKLLSGERMGAAAAAAALAALTGAPATIAEAAAASPYELAFDGTVMARWGIPEDRLPDGARVINRPPSLWADYRRQVIGTAIAMTLLGGVSVALLHALSSRRRAMTALARERGRLADRVRERTADLNRKAEELSRSNQELESFAYAVSHDLRAPLRAVRSYIQLLMRTADPKLDDDEREFAAHVRDGAGRLDAMIHGLLEYSRAGRREAEERRDLSPTEAIRDAVATMEMEIGFARAAITIDAPEALPALRANPVNLSRLLHNLIDNALKYRHPDRAPAITIAARRNEDELVLTVADNGLGIPPGQEERIFTLFQRLPHGDGIPGHGVGLALCRRIVETCGGRLWVESKTDEGCAFHAAFPVARPPAQPVETTMPEDARDTGTIDARRSAPDTFAAHAVQTG